MKSRLNACGGLFAIALIALAQPVRAELPDYVLDRDYQNCLGVGEVDPQRAEYCTCVRNAMRSWDIDTYGNVATQATTTANLGASAQPPAQLSDIAKACIAKVLH
jgi:hypothetical protein